MDKPKAQPKTKQTKPDIEQRIASLLTVVECTIPVESSTGNCGDCQQFKSIWNEDELDMLKTHLMDLATRL